MAKRTKKSYSELEGAIVEPEVEVVEEEQFVLIEDTPVVEETPDDVHSADSVRIMITGPNRAFTCINGIDITTGNEGAFLAERAAELIKLKLAKPV